MRVQRRTSILMAAVIVLAASCGGSGDDDSAEPNPEPAADQSDDGASDNAGGERGEVPDGLPPDFYLPADIVPGLVTQAGDAISFTGTMDEGTVDQVQADMVAGLTAAGYELLTNDDIAVFVKNGVGRVRVRTSDFLDSTTVNVDIDRWTDEQLDELRALFIEPISAAAQAVAVVDGVTYSASGECTLQGANRMFSSDDASLTIQIDETQDPVRTYADVTTPDGVVFGTEFGADLDYSASDTELVLSGAMTDYADRTDIPFTATATCG